MQTEQKQLLLLVIICHLFAIAKYNATGCDIITVLLIYIKLASWCCWCCLCSM